MGEKPKNLSFFQSVANERAPQSFLIYAGEAEQRIQTTSVLNYKHAIQSVE